MKKYRKWVGGGIVLISIVFFPFIGFDHYIGDHDVGDFWCIFIKSSPSFKFKFHNPAQIVLEIEPLDKLDDARIKELQSYCRIRYWVSDMSACYKKIYDDEF